MGKVNQLRQDLDEFTNEELRAKIAAIEVACAPFVNAYGRVRYYDSPGDDAQVVAMDDRGEGTWELFADEGEQNSKHPEVLLTIGHFADLSQFFRDGKVV